MIRPDPLGVFDLAVGILMLHTASPLPLTLAQTHAYFLIFKGAGTMLKPVTFPFPVFVLGGMADMMSAGIVITGTLPILTDYKTFIVGILFMKGFLSLYTLMSL